MTKSPSWSQPWSQVASVELTEALFAIGTTRHLSPGQLLYGRGDAGKELYGVQSGMIRVISHTANATEALLGLYSAGTFFGEVSLFDELPRPVSTYAVGETIVIVIPAYKVRQLLDQHPIWYRDFASVIAHKLRNALTYIENTFLPISARIVLRLLDLSQAYGKTVPDGLLIELKLPQEDLAHMLGLTRQSVNKELQKLRDSGWLTIRRGEITLVNLPALRSLVVDSAKQNR